MQISYSKIIIIVLLSSLLGILINLFSSRGIALVREKQELAWGNDSLISSIIDQKDQVLDPVLSEPQDQNSLPSNKGEEKIAAEQNQKDVIVSDNSNNDEEVLTEPVKINLSTAYNLYRKNVLFVDARPPEEFNEGHIKGAYSISYYAENVDELLSRIDKEQPVVVYCNGTDCDLSEMLGNKMFKLGFAKVFVFFGGWESWVESNYPVELQE